MEAHYDLNSPKSVDKYLRLGDAGWRLGVVYYGSRVRDLQSDYFAVTYGIELTHRTGGRYARHKGAFYLFSRTNRARMTNAKC